MQTFQTTSSEYVKADTGRKRKLSQSYSEAWVLAADKVVSEFAKPLTDNHRADLTRYFQDDVLGRPIDGVSIPRIASDDTTYSALKSGLSDGESVKLHIPIGSQDTLVLN